MLKTLHNLFFPHSRNNHRPKILHLSSLYMLVLVLLVLQYGLSYVQRHYPGVLGFAANIAPEEIIRLTNEQRQGSGLGTLSSNSVLSQAAMQKGADMFAKNYWAHFAPDGTSPWAFFKSAGYSYIFAGENLARDFQSSGEVVNAWMNSPTHRDNVMSGNYTEIGVAVINGVLDGSETTLVVQFFGTPSPSYVAKAPVQPTNAPLIAQIEPAAAKESVAETESTPILITTPTLMPTATPTIAGEQAMRESNSQLSSQTPRPGGAKRLFLGISSFSLTKAFSAALLAILIVILIIDSVLMVRKKTTRIGGKNLVHIAFLVIVLIIILLTTAGRII